MNFIQKVLNRQADLDEIDDYVEQWHKSASRLSLHEFLGLSREEYANWVEKPESLKKVVARLKEPEEEKFVDSVLRSHQKFLLFLSKDLSRGSISFTQFYLMSYLCTEVEIGITDISRKMGHSIEAAIGLVDRLEKLGYVERNHAAGERRKIKVHITAKGSALVEKLRGTLQNRVTEAMEEAKNANFRHQSGKRQAKFHDFVSALWQLEGVRG